jgi:DNA-binding CsgD family transcriptional regulator
VNSQPVSPHEFPPGQPDAPPPIDEDSPGAFPRAVIVILALVALGGMVDLALDRPQRWLSAHVLFELSLVTLSLASIAVLTVRWRRTTTELAGARLALATTRRSLAERQAERDAWRASAQSALAGLGVAIDRQFAAWGLTPTEREVALLLLKGVGHKQIAAHTGRSERTVRQHAVSVYQKAGLGGRAELAAFFLHDLMLPTPAGGAAPIDAS